MGFNFNKLQNFPHQAEVWQIGASDEIGCNVHLFLDLSSPGPPAPGFHQTKIAETGQGSSL